MLFSIKLGNLTQNDTDFDAMLSYGSEFFGSFDQLYVSGDLIIKQQIVSSMFPEKLIFENKSFRTFKANPLLTLIYRPSKAFGVSENKKIRKNPALSNWAPPSSVELNQIIEDMKVIYKLSSLLRGVKKVY